MVHRQLIHVHMYKATTHYHTEDMELTHNFIIFALLGHSVITR